MKSIPSYHEKENSLANAMRLSQQGDQEKYRELLRGAIVILKIYLTKYLFRMGLSDPSFSEDLLQEVLLALHLKRHTYDPKQPFTPWMFAIARYKLIDFLRKKKMKIDLHLSWRSSFFKIQKHLFFPILQLSTIWKSYFLTYRKKPERF